MSGDFFKVTKEFHACVEDSLAAVTSGEERTSGRRKFKHITAVAASIAIVAIVTVFTAHAAGVINLNNNFKAIFSIGNDDDSQQIIEGMSSLPTSTSISQGVTAKVVQCINDESNATLLVELTAKDKILNTHMFLDEVDVKIDGAIVSSFTAFTVPDEQVTKKRTIDDVKVEIDDMKNTIIKNQQAGNLYTAQDEASYLNQEKINYKAGYTDRIYFYVPIKTQDNMKGKKISLRFENLCGVAESPSTGMVDEVKIKGKWSFDWTLSSHSISKTYEINKEYGGIHYKDVTLTPISYEITYSRNLDIDYEDKIEYLKTELFGVRYKNGETHGILTGGNTHSQDRQSGSLGYNIIDIDQVQSIFVGDSFTEIPLQ